MSDTSELNTPKILMTSNVAGDIREQLRHGNVDAALDLFPELHIDSYD